MSLEIRDSFARSLVCWFRVYDAGSIFYLLRPLQEPTVQSCLIASHLLHFGLSHSDRVEPLPLHARQTQRRSQKIRKRSVGGDRLSSRSLNNPHQHIAPGECSEWGRQGEYSRAVGRYLLTLFSNKTNTWGSWGASCPHAFLAATCTSTCKEETSVAAMLVIKALRIQWQRFLELW